MRLTKIYTRTGDKGTTSLDGKIRLPKHAPVMDVVGGLDELNSAIGVVIAHLHVKKISHKKMIETLTKIQHHLFDIGGELSQPKYQVISAEHVIFLEKMIDDWNASLSPLKEFILPGGSLSASTCHLARAICRRVERHFFALTDLQPVSPAILSYMNRLSDVLFVAARVIDKKSKIKTTYWKHM
ncbi:MAG: cob(I)yrinic acid a,c-diamide adenosyltransferase [Gammaproteobacteria bacterium]|nr:cob(I)yrinic acid a,c-diamide adenosyltransferase [Gammaproteobacteria bacterium]